MNPPDRWEPGDRLRQALDFVTRVHATQRRKGADTPYIAHLLSVCALVIEDGGSEDEAIAALLHDAVEDGGGPTMQERITSEFGEAVGTMVAENSDSDTAVKEKWETRKAAYIAGMAHKSAGGLRVSLADKLHNARAIKRDLLQHGPAVWDRFTAKGPQTADHYLKLAAAFEEQIEDPGSTVAVAELRELAEALKGRT